MLKISRGVGTSVSVYGDADTCLDWCWFESFLFLPPEHTRIPHLGGYIIASLKHGRFWLMKKAQTISQVDTAWVWKVRLDSWVGARTVIYCPCVCGERDHTAVLSISHCGRNGYNCHLHIKYHSKWQSERRSTDHKYWWPWDLYHRWALFGLSGLCLVKWGSVSRDNISSTP